MDTQSEVITASVQTLLERVCTTRTKQDGSIAYAAAYGTVQPAQRQCLETRWVGLDLNTVPHDNQTSSVLAESRNCGAMLSHTELGLNNIHGNDSLGLEALKPANAAGFQAHRLIAPA